MGNCVFLSSLNFKLILKNRKMKIVIWDREWHRICTTIDGKDIEKEKI